MVYAHATGAETPDAALVRDALSCPGGCLAPFIAWTGQRWAEFCRLFSRDGKHLTDKDHSDFDAWIARGVNMIGKSESEKKTPMERRLSDQELKSIRYDMDICGDIIDRLCRELDRQEAECNNHRLNAERLLELNRVAIKGWDRDVSELKRCQESSVAACKELVGCCCVGVDDDGNPLRFIAPPAFEKAVRMANAALKERQSR